MPRHEESATVVGRAKLNLHLKVLAREASGYHTIETIFHKLMLSDTVQVTLRPRGQETITCNVDVAAPEQNIALRAARAFCQRTAWETGFAIDITKRIPVGAGLGGGSADAGATLRALNKLAPVSLPQSELLQIAGTLGADVPFLVSRAVMAFAWNRGDRMLVLDPMPQRHVVLVIPEFGIHTAEAYRKIDEASGDTLQTPTVLSRSMLTEWEHIASWATNDFTDVMVDIHPSIATSIATLRKAGAVVANMTGSGSVVFGIFDGLPDVNRIARETQCRVVVTHTARSG